MVIKVYVSGISGNKEVKKRQQRVLMILDSRHIKYEVVDIAEPDNESDKDFMQEHSKFLGATIGDANPKHPLPPQLFNDSTYCGDYDHFDLANETDEIETFLQLSITTASNGVVGDIRIDGAILDNHQTTNQEVATVESTEKIDEVKIESSVVEKGDEIEQERKENVEENETNISNEKQEINGKEIIDEKEDIHDKNEVKEHQASEIIEPSGDQRNEQETQE